MTLTQLSHAVRKLMPVLLIGLVVFFLFFIALRLVMNLRGRQNTPVVEQSKLTPMPNLEFSNSIPPPGELSFQLDNIEGKPVAQVSEAPVYPINKPEEKLDYLQNIYLMAKTLGFDTETNKHNVQDGGKTISFNQGGRSLKVDTSTFNLNYRLNYEGTPILFNLATAPNEKKAQEKAIEFLRKVNSYPEELAQGQTNVTYMNFDPKTKKITVVNKPVEANMVEVDFFSPDQNGLTMVSPKYFTSPNCVVMVPRDDNYTVIDANLSYYPKDTTSIGSYPIKSPDFAWQELNDGKATIVSPGGANYPIKIQKMFVAYYNPSTYLPFLQPIYVFLGDNNFVAYLPAIEQEPQK